jgi:tetratricopeptide (TPR) repeat protein
VTRFRLFVLLVSLASTALSQTPAEEPPEEDVSLLPKTEYVLNPLQAAKEIKVGNYYFKKGSYNAALRRYEESVKWDPNSAEGWYKLGETSAKLGDQKTARHAWTKYLELEPDGKNAAAVKKRLNSKS